MVLLLPLVKAEELITSLEGLLPSKSDDPVVYPVLQEPAWYFANSWSENLNETGFVEGQGVGYYKRFYAHSDMSAEFYVYRFSNVSSTEAYYDREINQTKFEGGYTEVLISGAFAVVYDYDTQEIGVSLGIIRNVVFKVAVYTANIVEDPTDQLVNFTILEQQRILENVERPESSSSVTPEPQPSPSIITPEPQPSPSSATPESQPGPSSSIPEFPSFAILQVLIIATLLVAIIISRRKQPAQTASLSDK
jgi:hypothetical protein